MTIWRNLFEMSIMQNNEEVVLHTTKEIKPSDFENQDEFFIYLRSLGLRWREGFYKPCLKFSRRINEEFETNLNTNYSGSVYNEQTPKITYIIDELTKMYYSLDFYINFLEVEPNKALVQWVASNFYDCLSGGASLESLAMARQLIEKFNVNLNEPVYPGKEGDGWYTLKDFLKEIKDVPDINHRLLPPGVFQLGK